MGTRRHSRTGALLALLVLPVVAGLGWWGGRASLPAPEKTADTGPVADAVLASSGVSAPPSRDADAPRPRRPDAPLPDLATPLRDTWQDLKQHADAGDAGAACRLAAELEFCDGIRQRLDSASASLHAAAHSLPAVNACWNRAATAKASRPFLPRIACVTGAARRLAATWPLCGTTRSAMRSA